MPNAVCGLHSMLWMWAHGLTHKWSEALVNKGRSGKKYKVNCSLKNMNCMMTSISSFKKRKLPHRLIGGICHPSHSGGNVTVVKVYSLAGMCQLFLLSLLRLQSTNTFSYLAIWELAKVVSKQPTDRNNLVSFNKWILHLENLVWLIWRGV